MAVISIFMKQYVPWHLEPGSLQSIWSFAWKPERSSYLFRHKHRSKCWWASLWPTVCRLVITKSHAESPAPIGAPWQLWVPRCFFQTWCGRRYSGTSGTGALTSSAQMNQSDKGTVYIVFTPNGAKIYKKIPHRRQWFFYHLQHYVTPWSSPDP